MGSAIPQGGLGEIVREARARTRVPAVAAGLFLDGIVEAAADGPCDVETPFRVASITKWFTASLACLVMEEPPRALLSHTAGLRSDALEPLPEVCRGLWSYSNAGFCAAGGEVAAAAGVSFSDAMRERILEPLELSGTSFEEPAGAAEGHVQEGETGHRRAGSPAYPVPRRPAGGLWSTVGDLLRFAEHQLGDPYGVQEPQAPALGAEYCLGCWRRELAGGRIAFDHEGSVGGFQSLLLVVPEERIALAVLTNSWRGSGLIRQVVKALGLIPASNAVVLADGDAIEPGRYELGAVRAEVDSAGGRWRIAESETDPLTGTRLERPAFPVEPVGGGVYGFAGGLLMGHRVDFPRPGVARIGWYALPRAGA
jgi:CubicO group peptidase (beta-lactamase class C family)